MKRNDLLLLLVLFTFSCKLEKATPAARSELKTMTPTSSAQSAMPAAIPRVVVRNAEMMLIVTDAASAASRLSAIASSAGGYVADSKQWRESDQLRATLTLRVPAQRLDETLAAARKLAARVENESIGTDDVTQETVDLDAQVRNLEAAETEMRELMTTVRQRTQEAKDILEVYQHLTELRGQIEQAKGRMRYLNQLAALATIKIDLVPDAIAKPMVARGWQPVAVARNAVRVLIATLQFLGTIAIWVVIVLVPVGLLFLAAALLIRGIVRTIRARDHA